MSHVLLVEDSDTESQFIKELLERAGLSVRRTRNGREALEAIQRSAPDVVLSDLNMPEMHGLEVIQFMRSHARYSEIPIIVLTTKFDTESRRSALDGGASQYLTKPFDPVSLRKRAAPFIVVSQVSIALPFALGCGLAALLFPAFSPPGVRFLPFALFMGIAMSITAFPVLARILTDRGLSRSELGVAALTCAAVDDVTAWCLLAIVVGVSRATLAGAAASAILAVAFIVCMFVAVRPTLMPPISMASCGNRPRTFISTPLYVSLCFPKSFAFLTTFCTWPNFAGFRS